MNSTQDQNVDQSAKQVVSQSIAAKKKGVILLNLGSPASPSTRDVRTYLGEFLNDPYVIDLPFVFRKLLVDGIILNTRPKKSAEAYQKIWAQDGSPLMINTRALTHKVAQLLSPEKTGKGQITVKMAMRYGRPSVSEILEEFKKEGVRDLVFLPLYPQYSYAASESSLVHFEKLRKKILAENFEQNVLSSKKSSGQPKVDIPSVRSIEDFFSEPGFINALADSMKEAIERVKPDLLLLSYHGIPERQIAKIKSPPQVCCTPGCCDQWNENNQKCYRAQCFENTRLLAAKLNLAPNQVMTTFQSRLGRTKWIEPYTDLLLAEFPKKGIKRILVASPSFTADCLETLEEIQLRYQELFLNAGGEYFEYLPCLNSRDDFAVFIADLVLREID